MWCAHSSMCRHECTIHRECVKVRGQLLGVKSLFHVVETWPLLFLGIPGCWGFSLVPTSHFAEITGVVTSSSFCGFGWIQLQCQDSLANYVLETCELLFFFFKVHWTRECMCVCLLGCLQQSKEGFRSPEAGLPGDCKHLGWLLGPELRLSASPCVSCEWTCKSVKLYVYLGHSPVLLIYQNMIQTENGIERSGCVVFLFVFQREKPPQLLARLDSLCQIEWPSYSEEATSEFRSSDGCPNHIQCETPNPP